MLLPLGEKMPPKQINYHFQGILLVLSDDPRFKVSFRGLWRVQKVVEL